MKFTAERNQLFPAVKSAFTAVERRNTIPVLNCLYLNADDDLVVTGTNLDMTAQVVAAKTAITEAGNCAVNGADLVKWLSAAPAGALVVGEADDKWLTLTCGRLSVSLPVFGEGFPIPAQDIDGIEVPGGISATRAVSSFHGKDETRYNICGVSFSHGHAVGYNGVVIGATECPADISAIVPHQAFPLIFSAPDDARLFIGPNMWRVEAEGIVYRGKLIDAVYPEWPRVFPQMTGGLRIDADAAIEAVSAVTIGRATAVRLITQDGFLRLEADQWGAEFAKSTAEVPCEGEPVNCLLNANFFILALKPFAGGVVDLCLSGQVLTLANGGSVRTGIGIMRDHVRAA